MEPATMGIHNNFLPLTYLPMAHTQAMTSTNSSFQLVKLVVRECTISSHNSTSGMRPLGIHCSPIKTICHRRNASTSQMDPVTLGMHRWPLVTTTSHYGHHQNINRLLAVSLNLMRHPSHASTITMKPATMGIRNNFLPRTHFPMAHTQAMITTDRSSPPPPPTLELPIGASWQPLGVQREPTPREA